MKQLFSFVLFVCLYGAAFAQNGFYQTDQIQDIRIVFEGDNWQYQLDSLRYNGDEFLMADLVINKEERNGAGVRFRADRSFAPRAKRNGLYIELPEAYAGHKVIDLSSALRDPSMVREVLAREIAGMYTPTPAANFAKVYINDEFYGLFVNVEVPEGTFLTTHYGNDQGSVIYANPDIGNTPPEGCSSRNYGSLQFEKSYACAEHNFDALQGNLGSLPDLAHTLDAAAPTPERYLDVDAALWMLAFNNLTVSLSSYSGQYANNYYLCEGTDKKYHALLGQLNLAFGSYKNNGESASDLRTPEMIQLSPMLHSNNEYRPMIKALLSNDMYRKQYLSHYRTMLVDWVLSGKLENRAKALQSIISNALAMDANKYYSVSEHGKSLTETIGTRSRIPGLIDFMDKRGNWLQRETVYTMIPPSISAVGVGGREQFSSEQLKEFRVHATVEGYPKKVYVYYRFGGSGAFMSAEMLDDGDHFDGRKNNDQFGAVIPTAEGQTSIEYYIVAENAKALNYSPVSYNFERYESNLSEVNE